MVSRQFIFWTIFLFSAAVFGQKKQITLLTDSISLGDNYTSRQIRFNIGGWIIQPESFGALDSIVTFMKTHNRAIFEVGVHTDSRPNRSCSKPSQKRAESIEEYLIAHGVPKENLIAKGFGGVYLLIPDKEIAKAKTKDEQEKLHALNRRVVFKVIGFK